MNDPKPLCIDDLPKPIADKLNDTSLRIRRITFLRGLFTVLSIALVTFLAVMVIDAAVLLFSSGIRWVLSLTAFTIIGLSVFWYILRPLSRKLSLSEIARIIETRTENLQDERISSTVEILSRQYKKGEEFSPVLLNQLVKDAAKDADVILPRQLFTLQSAKRVIVSLSIIGGVYLLLFVIWPAGSARLLVRAVAPFADVGGAMADRLDIRPGDMRLAMGDPLTIEVALHKASSREVELRTRWGGEPEQVEHMQSAEAEGKKKNFSTGFPRVSEDFEYRIRSGHALSRFFDVKVFPRPEISKVHMQVTPPEYTGEAPYTETFVTGRIEALAGSQIQLAVESNTPLETASLVVDAVSIGDGDILRQNKINLMQWTFPVSAPARSFDWQVKMNSRDGFANKPVKSHVFVVLGDQVPEVDLIQPVPPELLLPPDGFLTLEYQIRDDYGLSNCELKVTVDGERVVRISPSIGEKDGGAWPVSLPLYLQALNIEGAQRLKVELEVWDNLPESLGGPNRGVSESFRIVLERGRENFVRQQVKEQHDKTAATLRKAVENLEELNRKATEVEKRLQEEKTTEAMAKASEVRQGLAQADRELNDLVDELAHGVFDPVARVVEEVLNEDIREARELGENLPLRDQQDERQEIAADLQDHIETALEKIRDIEQLNDEMTDDALRLAEIEELNRQQDALVEQANADDWEENLEDWQAQQQALAEELAALEEQDQNLQELAENAQVAAENMQDAAENAEKATDFAEEVELPAWMIAQDRALQAQLIALAAQEQVLKEQHQAGNSEIAAMGAHQNPADKNQAAVDRAQREAEKAQQEALKLLTAGGPEEAKQVQEVANRLQAEAKRQQGEANTKQDGASKARAEESKNESPNVARVKARQVEAKQVQQRASLAQQKAIDQQKLALDRSEPAFDSALSDAVAQQQAAEAAQQAALEAQQQAEQALEASQDVASAQEAASQAQSAAENAQDQAQQAQEAASQAQEAAKNSENPQAEDAAEAAQQAASDAQNSAEQAQEHAVQAQEQAAQMQAESGQQAAAEAQQVAADSQQQAQEAQEAASTAQNEAAQAQQDAAASGAPEAIQEAQEAQNTANEAQETAAKAQEQASVAQRQAETIADQSVSNAQSEAAEAQQSATDAQQAVADAQQVAEEAATTPEQAAAQSQAAEAQQEAQASQQSANEAQAAATAAASQAQASGTAEDHAVAEAAQEAATTAQEQAAEAQEAATAAQPQTAATQSQTAAQQAAHSAEASASAATQAAQAAADAGLSQQAEQLNQLADSAEAAAQAMSEAATQPGLPSSNAAMAESAAQMAEIAESMQGLAPAPPHESSAQAMAQAASHAAEAAQSAAQSQPSQSQAAAQATAAAQALQQASQSMAQEMGMEAPPSESSSTASTSESSQGGKDNEGPNDEALPDWVSDIGLSRADWVRMRKLSNPDGANIDESGIPPEYRKLVRDYFVELNKERKEAP